MCIKYRRKVLTNGDIINTLKEKIIQLSEEYDVQIINQECDKDHIHILFKTKPQVNIVKYINILKGVTSRILRKKFPEIKNKLWGDSFWSDSYCLITTGQVTLDVLKKYVENQPKK